MLPAFDPGFAATADWAVMYRACGLQVVPSCLPAEGASWKRPAVAWKGLQDELVSLPQFERWYGQRGEHSRRPNMGVLTGKASRNTFVLDLDTHKNDASARWWAGVLAVHNSGIEPQTCQQITGGGGRQLLWHAPLSWVAPTNRTSIGVDIRGQGGFAVLPPSLHASGRHYEWAEGCAPWETEIAEAPDWLLEEIDKLVQDFGGASETAARSRVLPFPAAPGTADVNPFGFHQDGRETYMRDMVWAAIVAWKKQVPIPPSTAENETRLLEEFEVYERNTRSRLPFSFTESNADRLEKEGRGISLWRQKWRVALAQWDGKVAEDAKKDAPFAEPDQPYQPSDTPDTKQGEPPEPAAEIPDPPPGTDEPPANLPLVLTAKQFIAGFTPPDYLVDGILQRGYLMAMTARTGHGKTAVDMLLAACIALGRPFHGIPVKQGSVLFLAGENPDDIRARFLVLAEEMKFDPDTIPIHFIAGIVNVAASMPAIHAAAIAIGDLVLVVVDTAAAYFPGDDVNSNSQQGAYARLLRGLTFLPGKPTALVNCHPIKNAARDNLLPMGGSAFLNEIDGNLTLWANAEKQTVLHWLGKIRGPEFESIAFELLTATAPLVADAKGRSMPSVVARPISESTLEASEVVQEDDENKMMRAIHANPRASFAGLAAKLGWVAGKNRVQRLIRRLTDDKLTVKHRGGRYRLTDKGKAEIGIGREEP